MSEYQRKDVIETTTNDLLGIDMSFNNKSYDKKKLQLNQLIPPLEKFYCNSYAPWLLLSKGKVVKYDLRKMSVWRCVIMYAHTILALRSTWYLLGYLTIICFITEAIVYFTNGGKSIDTTISVFSRVYTLLSFVLAGHLSICVGRWDNLRNNVFGKMWGGLENINLIAANLLDPKINQDIIFQDKLLRFSRLTMRLLFLSAQENDDMTMLLEDKLLDPVEKDWLQACTVGTRPLMSCMWISNLMEDIISTRIVDLKLTGHYPNSITGLILDVKSGIGGTLGILGCPLPFAYVHTIYWTVQVSLIILAVETGVLLAIDLDRRNNGSGDYDNSTDDYTWPYNKGMWYGTTFFQLTFQNIFFAVFMIGILKVCEKMSNPLSTGNLSFPEFAYDIYLHNNIMAIRAGKLSYEDIKHSKVNNSNNQINEDSKSI